MNNIAHLIRLGNRIAHFFEAMPERQDGIDGIAQHLRQFWEPRMRRSLLDFLDRHPDGRHENVQLSEIALEAIRQHRDQLTPASSP